MHVLSMIIKYFEDTFIINAKNHTNSQILWLFIVLIVYFSFTEDDIILDVKSEMLND